MTRERTGHRLQPTALAGVGARKRQLVEMQSSGGLSLDETAEALQVSPDTVKQDWYVAKLRLRREFQGDGAL